jgi:flagellar hook-basal body complex protein FliE
MATPSIAASAYASLAKLTDPSASIAKSSDGGSSFGSMLKDQLAGLVETGRKSDAQSMAMVGGKANVVDVVTAVAETEVAVETLVSVRDRVISAYEDIMRMPI